MLGGLVRYLVKRFHKPESEQAGVLIASGLVAGDACIGVIIALLTVLRIIAPDSPPLLGPTFSIGFFLLLTLLFGWLSLRPPEKS